MKPPTRPPKTPSRLPDSLRHNLNVYALAASAAGVSLLALVQPSEAKIVYTKTHQVIGWNGTYSLDLNHDGIIDFLIQESGSSGSLAFNLLYAKQALGNGVEGSGHSAAALRQGAQIGPGKQFLHGASGEDMASVNRTSMSGKTFLGGPWANVTNRYLGLKFQIDGKTHYGWARLSVRVKSSLQITATLTSYAYETIPNKPILAGQTAGKADDATAVPDWEVSNASDPGPPVSAPTSDIALPLSLGALAMGTQSVFFRRRP